MLRIISFILSLLFLFPTTVYCADCGASSAIVMDADTNEILYQKNISEERSMASTTKIMTALIACESDKLDEEVTITDEMVDTIGTSLGLKVDDKITLYDLVLGMLIVSGNDAAKAVAVYLADSEENFSNLMNEKAKEIGMKKTFFVTASGLDEGNHHSTAYDMALLASYALKNEVFSKVCALKRAEITVDTEKRTIYNHNKLLSFLDDCVGVKTGFTEKAGRCLVSAVKRNNHTLVCVTLNDPNDWDDHISLYKNAEEKYSDVRMYNTISVDVVGGTKDTISAVYDATVNVVDKYLITVDIYHFPFLYAPVKLGDEIGKVVVKYKEKEILSVPLKADESVDYYGKQE